MKQIITKLTAIILSISLICTGCTQKSGNHNAPEQTTAPTSEDSAPADKADHARSGEMRDITSQQLLDDMTLGWNLGNSLDVCIADTDDDGEVNETPENGTVDETLWGNVRTTDEIFKTLYSQGINAVRIPVTWRDHTGEAPDYLIDEEWMNRVQEVVNYAYDLGMYVIINLHHDGGGDPDFGAWIRNASTDKETVFTRYRAVWNQIAQRFQNYSDHLIFESMNEVGFDDMKEAKAFSLLNEMNQTFVDEIRASGGNNQKRHLLIAGYWTDIEACTDKTFQMPEDSQNRCILSVHYYTPWQFCTTNQQNTWGTKEDLNVMKEKVALLKKHFTDKKIPVLIGEFGTGLDNDTDSRIKFCREFTSRCKKIGIPAFFWDNGGEFDRERLTWRTEGLLEAMQEGSGI